MPSTDTHVSVGLVYQAPTLNSHLKQALSELGARVVYDRPAAEFVYADLDATGAEVVVVNLDPDAEEEFAALDDLLTDETRRVVFNDGEVSSRLAGWDQARWARHLAAKILGLDENMPPRPEGAIGLPLRGRIGSAGSVSRGTGGRRADEGRECDHPLWTRAARPCSTC